ncbi:hypothetical protein OS493_002365 [Desmophyllum pertusum]|uniref:Uncharacterized protein n=1 Tax=Desmophyllum pertusum TaxID=174260 RepID=A0A9X0CNZ1_9CNID|nr:hypothetical protein OS493_002365 [Desmophyllum pertusum]
MAGMTTALSAVKSSLRRRISSFHRPSISLLDMLADLLVPARKSCFVVEAIPGQAISAATSTSYCSFVPPCPGTRLTAASATKTPTNIDKPPSAVPLVFEGCGEMLFIVDDCAVSSLT